MCGQRWNTLTEMTPGVSPLLTLVPLLVTDTWYSELCQVFHFQSCYYAWNLAIFPDLLFYLEMDYSGRNAYGHIETLAAGQAAAMYLVSASKK